MRTIRRAAHLTVPEWRYLTIASLELFTARIRLFTSPAEKILRELQAGNADQQRSTLAKIDVERLSWAISVVAPRVPWLSDCLVKVMAADRWLRRHHLYPDFYLGVAKDE